MIQRNHLKIVFILADSSLELIPRPLHNDPIIKKYALRKRKPPSELILDATYHYKPINKSDLPDKHKRGRPDIVHRALLTILDSQLAVDFNVDIYVHTIDNKLIWINPNARLPRHYARFIGLMETLLTKKEIIDKKTRTALLKIIPMHLREIIVAYDKYIVIGFSRLGKLVPDLDLFTTDIVRKALRDKKKALINVIGCFPSGHFSNTVRDIIDVLVAISTRSLTTSYTLCKVINSYERYFSRTY